jgi:hypothetical protein
MEVYVEGFDFIHQFPSEFMIQRFKGTRTMDAFPGDGVFNKMNPRKAFLRIVRRSNNLGRGIQPPFFKVCWSWYFIDTDTICFFRSRSVADSLRSGAGTFLIIVGRRRT